MKLTLPNYSYDEDEIKCHPRIVKFHNNILMKDTSDGRSNIMPFIRFYKDMELIARISLAVKRHTRFHVESSTFYSDIFKYLIGESYDKQDQLRKINCYKDFITICGHSFL